MSFRMKVGQDDEEYWHPGDRLVYGAIEVEAEWRIWGLEKGDVLMVCDGGDHDDVLSLLNAVVV